MLAVGILIGVAFQKPDVCQRLCCAAREKWKKGEDPGMPPEKPREAFTTDKNCNNQAHFFKSTEVGDKCNCRNMEIVLERGVRVVRPAMTPPPFHLNLNVDL